MIEILENKVKEKENEVLEYAKTCSDLDAALASEGVTFAQAYDILMDDKYKDIVSQNIWAHTFKKFQMPFQVFRGQYAILKYESFTLSVPMHKYEEDKIQVHFDFWDEMPSNPFAAIKRDRYAIERISGAIYRLENAFFNQDLSIFDMFLETIKNAVCKIALEEAHKCLPENFPAANNKTFFSRRSRDAYINEVLQLLKDRRARHEAEVAQDEGEIAAVMADYEKVKPELERVLTLFDGSFYGGKCHLNLPVFNCVSMYHS